MDVAFAVNCFDFNACLRNVLSVRSRIHVNCSAETSWNSCKFVNACKPFVDGIAGDAGERCGSFCADFPVAEIRYFREKFTELDDDSVESVVGDE